MLIKNRRALFVLQVAGRVPRKFDVGLFKAKEQRWENGASYNEVPKLHGGFYSYNYSFSLGFTRIAFLH